MKPSTKAALWSGLVFPGLGLWMLKHYGRALIFMIPALLALVFLLVNTWRIAQQIADGLVQDILASGSLAINPGHILLQVREAIAANPLLEQCQWFFIAAWGISIISSYFAGRVQEQALAANGDSA